MHLCLVKLRADVFSTFFRLVERGRSILKKGGRDDSSVYPQFSISALFQVLLGWELCLVWCLPGCR